MAKVIVRGIGLRSGVSRVGGSITLWPKTSVVRLWARYGTKKRTRRRQAGVFSKKTRCSTVSPTVPRPSSRTSAHVSPLQIPVSSLPSCCCLSTLVRMGSSLHSLGSSTEISCASCSSELDFSASCTSLPVPHALSALRETSRYTSGATSKSSIVRATPRSPLLCDIELWERLFLERLFAFLSESRRATDTVDQGCLTSGLSRALVGDFGSFLVSR